MEVNKTWCDQFAGCRDPLGPKIAWEINPVRDLCDSPSNDENIFDSHFFWTAKNSSLDQGKHRILL